MKILKQITLRDDCLVVSVPVSPEIREFIEQIGRSLFSRQAPLSPSDIEALILFSVEAVAEELNDCPAHFAPERYIERAGGLANLLEDALQFRIEWPVFSAVLQEQFALSAEHGIMLTLFAHSLYQLDQFLEHRESGDAEGGFAALSVAAMLATKASYYAGFESPIIDGFAIDVVDIAEEKSLAVTEYSIEKARRSANARWAQQRSEKQVKVDQIRAIFATGKYSSRDLCAEEECAALGMSFSSARKALKNVPNPDRYTSR